MASAIIEYMIINSMSDIITPSNMRNTGPYLIKSEKQLAVLACAIRQEILDVLAEMGAVSIAELAASLGRPPDGLYFHLRRLTQSGLVQRVGYRFRSKRREALYRTVAPELMLQYKPEELANRNGVRAIVGSMLRLGIRDFGRALQKGNVVVTGAHREIWALRRTGRLSWGQIPRINRLIQNLRAAIASPSGRGRLYAVTVVLTPLDRRRKSERTAPAGRTEKSK